MKLMSYQEALIKGKEKVKKSLIPIKVKQARKQAELKLCELEEQEATLTMAINEECTGETLNFESIIEAQDELALLQRRMGQYHQLMEQMFPEE